MPLTTKLIAFDLDGTLVDSAPDLAACIDGALAHAGLPPPGEARVRGWIGDGVETLVRRALEDAAGEDRTRRIYDAVFADFTKCYRRQLFDRSRLYDGAQETLGRLHAAGVRLCCITNKRIEFANALLERAGILGYFDCVHGGDSLEGKKPEPVQLEAAARYLDADPKRSVMVGDSAHDQRAALAAGFRFIWAAWGYGSESDLAEPENVVAIHALTDLWGQLP